MTLSAIISKIRSDTSLSVYPVAAPPNTKPNYVVVNTDSYDKERHYGDGRGLETAIDYYDFEVQVFSSVPDTSINLSKTIKSSLENFSGPVSGLDAVSYEIMDIEVTSELSDYDKARELFYYSIFITVATRS